MAGGGRLFIVSVILLILAVAGYFYFTSSLETALEALKAKDEDTDSVENAINVTFSVALLLGKIGLIGLYFSFNATRKLMTFSVSLLIAMLVASLYPYVALMVSKDVESIDDIGGVAYTLHLWLPVFVSVAVFAICCILVKSGSSGLLRGLSNICAGVATWIGRLASWIIVPLVLIIMVDVVTRKIEVIKVWNSGITQTYGFSVSFLLQDFQWHLHGVLLLMTFGFGYIMNSHVRVDIFREAASHRGQVWIETLGLTLLAIPFMMVMIGFSWDLFYASFTGWEGSESMVGLGWRWIIKSFLIWGFAVALMAALGTLFRCVIFLFGDEDESAAANDQLQFFTDKSFLPKVVLEDGDGGPDMNKKSEVGGH